MRLQAWASSPVRPAEPLHAPAFYLLDLGAPSRASKRMASVGRDIEFWQLLLIRHSGFGSFPAGCNPWRTSQTVHDLPSLEGTWSFNFMTPSSVFLKRNCRADLVLPSITRLLQVHEICSLKGVILACKHLHSL